MPTLFDLPLETIHLIAHFARQNDLLRTQIIESKARLLFENGKSGEAEGTCAMRLYEAHSLLSFGTASRSLREAILPVFWKGACQPKLKCLSPLRLPTEYLDLSDVELHQNPRGTFLLKAYNYGIHVRQLQITINLPSSQSHSPYVGNVDDVVGLLACTVLLTSLEIYLTTREAGAITQIPRELSLAFRAHRTRLHHFGVTCRGEFSGVRGVRLAENSAAELIASFPYLSFLTLHRIGSEAASTPLLDAVATLQGLKRLKLLDVQAVDDKWATRPFASDVNEIMLLCCSRLSPQGLEGVLSMHRSSLSHLSLVNTPAAHHAVLPAPANKAKYDLPSLISLLIESDTGHADSIVYLERFSQTPLRELDIRYAAGITSLELYSLIAKREMKHLKELSIGLFGLKNTREQDLSDLCRRTLQYGVCTTVDGKSSLVESVPDENDRVDLPPHGL